MIELELATQILEAAKKNGADSADVFIQSNTKFEAEVREGKTDRVTQADSKGIGLRVFKNNRLGFACSNDFTPSALENLVQKAIQLANVTSADQANGLADAMPLANINLDLYDPAVVETDPSEKIKLALRAEKAMFDTDKRIVNSEGCQVATNVTKVTLLNTNGMQVDFATTDCAVVAVPIAADDSGMQAAYDYKVSRKYADLSNPEAIGRRAAELVLQKLGAKKVQTQQVPVILDRRVASSFIGGVFSAVDGDAVSRQRSFLADKLNTKIASEIISIEDNGLIPGALGSAPCDDEGVAMQKTQIVDNGVLVNFLYDVRAAKKTGNKPTGNGQRSYSAIPRISPSNFYLKPGTKTPEELIAQVQNGFLVYDIMGHGLDPISGDVSFGAAGMWIENGKMAYPVEEVTIAGSLIDILGAVEAVGNDLIWDSTCISPTLLIGKMTVAGM